MAKVTNVGTTLYHNLPYFPQRFSLKKVGCDRMLQVFLTTGRQTGCDARYLALDFDLDFDLDLANSGELFGLAF